MQLQVVDQFRELDETLVPGQRTAVVMQFRPLPDEDPMAAKERIGRTTMTLEISGIQGTSPPPLYLGNDLMPVCVECQAPQTPSLENQMDRRTFRAVPQAYRLDRACRVRIEQHGCASIRFEQVQGLHHLLLSLDSGCCGICDLGKLFRIETSELPVGRREIQRRLGDNA